MSFSLSAGGTRQQTLSCPARVPRRHDSLSKQAADLIVSMIEAAPDETTVDGQVHDAVFAISAYGYSSAGHDLPRPGIGVFLFVEAPRDQQ